jgi:hypothetical protein
MMAELPLPGLCQSVLVSHVELDSQKGRRHSHNPSLIYKAVLHDYKMVCGAD